MIVTVESPATKENLDKMRDVFDHYIKIVVDLSQKKLAGGCELHHDCEEILLKQGSNQENLWGGGVELTSKNIEFNSLTNIRPEEGNPSQEILDPEKRKKFEEVVGKLLLEKL